MGLVPLFSSRPTKRRLGILPEQYFLVILGTILIRSESLNCLQVLNIL